MLKWREKPAFYSCVWVHCYSNLNVYENHLECLLNMLLPLYCVQRVCLGRSGLGHDSESGFHRNSLGNVGIGSNARLLSTLRLGVQPKTCSPLPQWGQPSLLPSAASSLNAAGWMSSKSHMSYFQTLSMLPSLWSISWVPPSWMSSFVLPKLLFKHLEYWIYQIIL